MDYQNQAAGQQANADVAAQNQAAANSNPDPNAGSANPDSAQAQGEANAANPTPAPAPATSATAAAAPAASPASGAGASSPEAQPHNDGGSTLTPAATSGAQVVARITVLKDENGTFYFQPFAGGRDHAEKRTAEADEVRGAVDEFLLEHLAA